MLALVAAAAISLSAEPADDGRFSKPRLRFTRIGLDDGLSQADVRALAQDHQGFMWFGTWLDGVSRFDGYGFRPYRHSAHDERSLSFNSVNRLLVDRHHDLWVGTHGGGLKRYERATDTFIRYRQGSGGDGCLPDDMTRALYEDPGGTVWVGAGPAVNRFDRETGRFVTYTPSSEDDLELGDRVVRAICRDRNTNLVWVGSRAGVHVLDPETGVYTPLVADDSVTGVAGARPTYAIIQDRAGAMWVGSHGGLEKWDPQTRTCIEYRYDPADPRGLSAPFVTALHEDRRGRFWVGTLDGLNLLDRVTGRFHHYRHDPHDPTSLSDNNINFGAIFEDNTGALWFGTAAGGVSRLAGEAPKFGTFQHDFADDASLSQDTVTALYSDSVGRLWVGTAGGLNCYEGSAFRRYVSDPNDEHTVSPFPIWAIAETADGRLWVGTAGGGLCSFDGNRFTRYRHEPADPGSLAYDTMYALLPDAKGGLWIALHGRGLDYFDGQEFIHFPSREGDPESLADGYVGTLVFGEDGGLWMGSSAMGLLRFDPVTHRASRYLLDPAMPGNKVGNWVRDICSDGRTIWVGSYSGLYRFDVASRTYTSHYTEREGMASRSVLSVELDARGDVWASTVAGLSHLDPRSGSIRNYDITDGLQSAQFSERARARLPDGRMCFGGAKGFNLFLPGHMPDNPAPPPVVLTDFRLNNRPVSVGADSPLTEAIHVADRIVLRHRQQVFSIGFSGLDYTASRKNEYAYMLEGFDADWRFTGSENRRATYTGLRPGEYVFRVRASNNDGVWNERGASIAITIVPPWWHTLWFRFMITIGAAAAAFGIYEWRVLQVRRVNRRLEGLVAVRTAELRKSEEALIGAVRELDAKSGALEAANKELESFSYSVSHDLRAPLRAIDGFSQILLEENREGLDAEAQRHLDTIRASTKRMSLLIDDMLRLARIGRSAMRWETVDLSCIATEIAAGLRAAEPAREVEFAIAPDCVAQGDGALLRIAMENMLGNAWKYTGKTARAKIEFGLAAADPEPVWFVRDNGCGFDMKYADRLFGCFQRLHSGTEFPGTGVGLATVQRIVVRHGGRVWIEGEVDKGATIRFTLGNGPAGE